jgi:hypothetical protein
MATRRLGNAHQEIEKAGVGRATLPGIGPVKTRLRFDVPPMSGKVAQPTILPASRQNPIHPSGDPMMFNNSWFFPCIRCFRHGQPRNLGLLNSQ